MTAAAWMAIWGVSALIAAIAGGVLAGRRNRDRSAWTAWGFVIPPSVLLLWLLPALDKPRRRGRRRDGDEEADAADVADLLGDKSD